MGMGLCIGLGIGMVSTPAPAAPTFDPALEYSPDAGYDNAAAWSASRCNVNSTNASALTVTSNIPGGCTGVATAAAVLGATYRATCGPGTVSTPALAFGSNAVTYPLTLGGSSDFIVSDVSSPTLFKVSWATNENNHTLSSVSVKRIA